MGKIDKKIIKVQFEKRLGDIQSRLEKLVNNEIIMQKDTLVIMQTLKDIQFMKVLLQDL